MLRTIKTHTMRHITKLNADKFVKQVTKYLLKIGAVQQVDEHELWHVFELDSIAGLLTIHLPMADRQDVCYTVFSKFSEPDKAKAFRCNPYSGKYNLHVGIKDFTTVMNNVRWFFGSTLPIEK